MDNTKIVRKTNIKRPGRYRRENIYIYIETRI